MLEYGIVRKGVMFLYIREFVRFWKYNTHPIKMEARARKVVLFGANKALEFFNDKKFRLLSHFEQKDEEERNRIFNELTLTNIVLLMLLLEQMVLEIDDDEHKNYIRTLRKEIPVYFSGFIRRIKIPERYANLWDKLIEKRYNEYQKAILEMRGEFLQQDNRNLQTYALDKTIMIFQAIAFGLYEHLVRGKIREADSLYKYLQPYLLAVYKGFQKRI
jgi:hypothetical protein